MKSIPAESLGGWRPLKVTEVAALFREAPFPWWIVGGLALDLFIGRTTRAHTDIEAAVLRRDIRDVQRWLSGWELWYVPSLGSGLIRWEPDDELPASAHEIWSRRDPGGEWELELLVEEAEADRWRYRRDERLSGPLDAYGMSIDGVRVIRPEIALLYKSKAPRERDERDFQTVLPRLDSADRMWLLTALELVAPASAWIALLRAELQLATAKPPSDL